MEGATPRLINYEQKLVVVYCYRPTGSAQTHAISIELRHQNEQLAFIEPIHCWGLRQTQINLWLYQALSKLSRTYRLDPRDLICSFTLDPSECPLQPCPPFPVFSDESDEEEQVTLTREEIRYGGWCNIWAYQRFYASLLATYAGISDQDAIELLFQLAAGGYVKLDSQIRDVLLVRSHAFTFNPRRKTYPVDPTKTSMHTNMNELRTYPKTE